MLLGQATPNYQFTPYYWVNIQLNTRVAWQKGVNFVPIIGGKEHFIDQFIPYYWVNIQVNTQVTQEKGANFVPIIRGKVILIEDLYSIWPFVEQVYVGGISRAAAVVLYHHIRRNEGEW